jgi:hypothetical protein
MISKTNSIKPLSSIRITKRVLSVLPLDSVKRKRMKKRRL